MKTHQTIKEMVLCALFAAILCICSPLSIPIGPVPLTLSVFAVLLCAVTLKLRTAWLSVAVYLVLGLFLPLFSGGRNGLAAMTGVTGGYIWSYLLMVPVVRAFAGAPVREAARYPLCLLGCVLAVGVCYMFGTAQFSLVAGGGVHHAVEVCVLPFVLPDLAKAACASALGLALRRILDRLGLQEQA